MIGIHRSAYRVSVRRAPRRAPGRREELRIEEHGELRIAEARVSARERVCEAGVRDRKKSHICESVICESVIACRVSRLACRVSTRLSESDERRLIDSSTHRLIDSTRRK